MQPDEPEPSKLLAISVGLPRETNWHGQTIQTGIFKYPIEGRVGVGRLGIEGDGQADLSVHVSASTAESTRPSTPTTTRVHSTGVTNSGVPNWLRERSARTSHSAAGRKIEFESAICFESDRRASRSASPDNPA